MLEGFRVKRADADTPAPSDEAVLLTEIRDLLAGEQRRPSYRPLVSPWGSSPSRPT